MKNIKLIIIALGLATLAACGTATNCPSGTTAQGNSCVSTSALTGYNNGYNTGYGTYTGYNNGVNPYNNYPYNNGAYPNGQAPYYGYNPAYPNGAPGLNNGMYSQMTAYCIQMGWRGYNGLNCF